MNEIEWFVFCNWNSSICWWRPFLYSLPLLFLFIYLLVASLHILINMSLFRRNFDRLIRPALMTRQPSASIYITREKPVVYSQWQGEKKPVKSYGLDVIPALLRQEIFIKELLIRILPGLETNDIRIKQLRNRALFINCFYPTFIEPKYYHYNRNVIEESLMEILKVPIKFQLTTYKKIEVGNQIKFIIWNSNKFHWLISCFIFFFKFNFLDRAQKMLQNPMICVCVCRVVLPSP